MPLALPNAIPRFYDHQFSSDPDNEQYDMTGMAIKGFVRRRMAVDAGPRTSFEAMDGSIVEILGTLGADIAFKWFPHKQDKKIDGERALLDYEGLIDPRCGQNLTSRPIYYILRAACHGGCVAKKLRGTSFPGRVDLH